MSALLRENIDKAALFMDGLTRDMKLIQSKSPRCEAARALACAVTNLEQAHHWLLVIGTEVYPYPHEEEPSSPPSPVRP